MGIKVHLDVMMAQKGIGLVELANKILKNNKAKAIRFTTLEAICRELDCQPGDIIEYKKE